MYQQTEFWWETLTELIRFCVFLSLNDCLEHIGSLEVFTPGQVPFGHLNQHVINGLTVISPRSGLSIATRHGTIPNTANERGRLTHRNVHPAALMYVAFAQPVINHVDVILVLVLADAEITWFNVSMNVLFVVDEA